MQSARPPDVGCRRLRAVSRTIYCSAPAGPFLRATQSPSKPDAGEVHVCWCAAPHRANAECRNGKCHKYDRHFLSRSALSLRTAQRRRRPMKWVVALTAATVVFTATANAQSSRAREPDAKNGQPITGQPQTSDPRTTTGQAPVAVPGAGNPYGAKGGATGAVNPDRVPEGSPGGNPISAK
jgi:hypothetical protein